jgi:proliferating cell nuclear antigen
MFDATLSQAAVWKRCVDAISTLIEEGIFSVNQNKISFNSMDPARISMVDFELSSEAFETFELDAPKNIGLNLEDMNKMLRRARPGDRLKMTLDEQTNRFVMTFQGISVTTFSIPLLDLGESSTHSPEIPFTATVRMEAGVLSEALKDVGIVGDHVTLRATPDFLRLEGESDVESVNVRLNKQSEGVAHMEVKEECRSIYIISYISNMLKAAEATDIIEYEFGQDLPLKLTVPLEGGKISFLLAPRVED